MTERKPSLEYHTPNPPGYEVPRPISDDIVRVLRLLFVLSAWTATGLFALGIGGCLVAYQVHPQPFMPDEGSEAAFELMIVASGGLIGFTCGAAILVLRVIQGRIGRRTTHDNL